MDDGHYGYQLQKPAVGTDGTAALTYADVLAGDGQVPPAAVRPGGTSPERTAIPFERYHDPRYVALEVEHIWNKCWQVACREEDIPNVGDRIAYDVVDNSFVIARTAPGEIKAYYNSCPHRGRRLCDHAENRAEFRCPFHAWTWDLHGRLQWVPAQHDFPYVTTEDYSLQQVRVETWGGNVFINPDPQAPPLLQALGVLPQMFQDFPLEDRYTVLHVRKRVRANWKLTQEAFMEGYHVIETHWDGMPFFGSASTQYDCWDDGVSHVNRLVTPSVVPDVWVRDQVSPRASLEQFCSTFNLPQPPVGRGETIADARRYAAAERRKLIEAASGVDLSDRPVAYLLDMVKFFMFPNHHPWWGEALPWWYRFLPVGEAPDQSVMEIRVTAPVPKEGPRPPPAQPIDIDFDERAADYEDRIGVLGYIIDQDISNLVEIQKGVKAARPDRAYMSLARYQECNIQHFHNAYAEALGLPSVHPRELKNGAR